MCRSIAGRSIVDAVEPTVDQAGDLSLERLLGNGVHAAARTFKPAIPRCKRLTVAKCRPNASGTGTAKSFLSSGSSLGDQAGCAPVASATGIGKPRRGDSIEVHPTGNVTAEPMAIPQTLVTEGLHLKQNRGAACHRSANAGEAMVGVFDDMSESERFRQELVGRLAGWLEDHQRATGRCFGGQCQSAARQAVQKERRRAGKRLLDPLRRVDGDRLEWRHHVPQRGHDQENRWSGRPSLLRRISWTMMGV